MSYGLRVPTQEDDRAMATDEIRLYALDGWRIYAAGIRLTRR